MKRALIACVLMLGACDAIVSPPPGARQAAAMAPANLPAFFDCLRERGQTAVSAHRGGWRRGLPENTLSTFASAVKQAPVFLEIDLRPTRDGQIVVMHDDSVDRTTNGFGALAEMTLAQVQALRVKDESGRTLDEHPPSLREALDWASAKTVLELDIKPDVRYEDVIAQVEAAGAMGRVVFITPSVGAAGRLARLAPAAMIYVTIDDARDLDQLERRGVELSHIVAWTGDEEPNSALNSALGERGVETRLGLFGRAPAEQAGAYAQTGLQIISANDPEGVVANLDHNDGVDGYGALSCVPAR